MIFSAVFLHLSLKVPVFWHPFLKHPQFHVHFEGAFFWDVMPCNLIDTYILSSQIVILVYQTVARHIPEECIRDIRCRDNLKCHSDCSFPVSVTVVSSITYSRFGCVFNPTCVQLSSGRPSGLRKLLYNGLLKYEMVSRLGTR